MMDLTPYLDFARETARQAGQLTLQYFQTNLNPETKQDGSPVTIADRQSEASIRRAIEARFPDHAILGEEYGASAEGRPFRWIIDPIDGTKSFIHGVPLYAVLLGLEIEGQVEVGVVYMPALDEMVSAATGLGCWWNGRRARVSTVDRLDKAVVSCTDFNAFEAYGLDEPYRRLARRAGICPGWTDAYGYALVATGRCEVMLDPVMAIWDAAPFPPLLREAGGYFGDWRGNPTITAGQGLAVNAALLPEVLDVLNERG